MKKNCFIILGMHRSGTSATTGLLSHFNITLGTALIDPNDENPKGFFENRAVLELNKKILSAYQSNWDDYHFNLNDIQPDEMKTWVAEAQTVLEKEFSDNENFAMKDPRLCLLFPIWEQALKKFNAHIKVIIVNRNPSAVASSLKTRNGFRDQKSQLLWAKYTLSLEQTSRGHDRLVIQYPSSFLKTPELISELKRFTELTISDSQLQKAMTFYDNSLTRHQIVQKDISNDTPPLIGHILSLLDSGKLTQSDQFNSLYKELDLLLNFFSDKQLLLEKDKQLSSNEKQIRQRNKRIKQLEANIEITTSDKISSYEKEIAEITKKLTETKQEALNYRNRASELEENYQRHMESNKWIKRLFKFKPSVKK